MNVIVIRVRLRLVLPQNKGREEPVVVIVLIWLLHAAAVVEKKTVVPMVNPAQRNQPLIPFIREVIQKSVCPPSWREVFRWLQEEHLMMFDLYEVQCLTSQNTFHQPIIFHLLSEAPFFIALYLGPSPSMSINISYQPLSVFIALNHEL